MASPRNAVNELPLCLAKTVLNFRRFGEQTLRAVGLEDLAPGYASVLHAAETLGDCTVNTLVEQTNLPNGTLTGLLDGLERDGYLRRAPNPTDGRSWLIQLTPKGRRLCRKLRARHDMVADIFSEVYTEAEAAQMIRLLGKITNRMRAYLSELEAPKGPGVSRAKSARKR